MVGSLDVFFERKDHLIRRHPDFNTLLPEQQEYLLNYFSSQDKTPSLNIDWNKLASYDIQDILKATYELSKTGKEKAVKRSGIEGLKDGEDYLEFPVPDPDIKVYIPLNYEASKLIASSRIGPCEGKWCTAYQKTDEYWIVYAGRGAVILYIVTPKTKYAAVTYSDGRLDVFTATDKKIPAELLNGYIDIKNMLRVNQNLIKKARDIITEYRKKQFSKYLNRYLDGSLPIPDKATLKNLIDSNMDLSRLDVSEIVDMSELFLGSDFNGDISNWDVSNVTNMEYMFYDSTFNNEISDWDVSSVTNMSKMFAYSKFNGDISRWDVSNVTDMTEMFYYSEFNSNISRWDVSNVTDMDKMFYNSKFNGDISRWDVSNVSGAEAIFMSSPLEQRYPNGLDDLKKEQRLKENALKDWLYEDFLC